MAYNPTYLLPIAAGGGMRRYGDVQDAGLIPKVGPGIAIWCYVHTDSVSTVSTSGYFDGSPILTGDLVFVIVVDSLTHRTAVLDSATLVVMGI